MADSSSKAALVLRFLKNINDAIMHPEQRKNYQNLIPNFDDIILETFSMIQSSSFEGGSLYIELPPADVHYVPGFCVFHTRNKPNMVEVLVNPNTKLLETSGLYLGYSGILKKFDDKKYEYIS